MTDPISPAERIQVVDILRGFAIFGILLVNMELFNSPIYQVMMGLQVWDRLADRAADLAIRFLAEGKFYTIFSFLFGFGLAMQMTRAESRGARFVPLYARRLSVLLLIGAMHAVLLWMGDILMSYAVLGFLLILFRHRSRKALILWAAASLLISILLTAGLVGLVELAESQFGRAEGSGRGVARLAGEYQRLADQATRSYGQGTFAEILQQRIKDLKFIYSFEIFFLPHFFAMFLLGLYAGRRGVFESIPSHLPFIRRVMAWGLGIGIVGNLVFVIGGEYLELSESFLGGLVSSTAYTVGAPALSAFYMSAITLLVQKDAWRQRLSPLAAVGRMALSNYLFQSLICTTIFYSYGLGLYGKVGPAAGAALTIAIFAVQIPLSVWWLRRFRFGPMEWLWRSLTYRRLQPMRPAGISIALSPPGR